MKTTRQIVIIIAPDRHLGCGRHAGRGGRRIV